MVFLEVLVFFVFILVRVVSLLGGILTIFGSFGDILQWKVLKILLIG
jgi:hypothetical protein